jgi:hypothetical protein
LPLVLDVIRRRAEAVGPTLLREPVGVARKAADHLESWWAEAGARGGWLHEAGARRFAVTLGRTLALAILTEHAAWSLANEADGRCAEAARRFARLGVDRLVDVPRPPGPTTALALGEAIELER